MSRKGRQTQRPAGSPKITESIICAIIVQFVIYICAINKLIFFPSCRTVAKQMVKVMGMFSSREPVRIIYGLKGPKKSKSNISYILCHLIKHGWMNKLIIKKKQNAAMFAEFNSQLEIRHLMSLLLNCRWSKWGGKVWRHSCRASSSWTNYDAFQYKLLCSALNFLGALACRLLGVNWIVTPTETIRIIVFNLWQWKKNNADIY